MKRGWSVSLSPAHLASIEMSRIAGAAYVLVALSPAPGCTWKECALPPRRQTTSRLQLAIGADLVSRHARLNLLWKSPKAFARAHEDASAAARHVFTLIAQAAVGFGGLIVLGNHAAKAAAEHFGIRHTRNPGFTPPDEALPPILWLPHSSGLNREYNRSNNKRQKIIAAALAYKDAISELPAAFDALGP